MKKFFGTDGIRGHFFDDYDALFVIKLGMAAGQFMKQETTKPKIVIAKDTRITSDLIEDAISSGLMAQGIDVYKLGYVPTPVVSYTIANNDFDYGIMISASHNPFHDNGIKFFGSDGHKLNDDKEKIIENLIDQNQFTSNLNDLGRSYPGHNFVEKYIDFIVNIGKPLNDFKIGIDTANGATYEVAVKIFEKLGAEVFVMANNPNGYNINDEVGSTNTKALSEFVTAHKLDFGFAYDGDGDRLMMIDKNGQQLDGDYIIYMLALMLKEEGKLQKDQIVTTVMANMGLFKALDEAKISYHITKVGDKYVMEEMAKQGAVLGGEQSGHVILSDYIKTGDGIMVSVMLASFLKTMIKDLDHLAEKLVKYPQILKNIKVDNKITALEDVNFLAKIDTYTNEIQNDGRILVRASGTENLLRVMVEHVDEDKAQEITNDLVNYLKTNHMKMEKS